MGGALIIYKYGRAVDYDVKIESESEGTGVDIANVKMALNPLKKLR